MGEKQLMSNFVLVRLTMAFMLAITMRASHATNVNLQPLPESMSEWTELERRTLNYAEINWANASAPFGRLLLIEYNENLCAIKFVNFIRGQDKKKPSFFSSGEETLTSVYEWYSLERNKEHVSVINSGKDYVQFKAPHGFGHLIVGGGYGSVKCGNIKLGWQYPDAINFVKRRDSVMRIAPTSWKAIEEIDLSNNELSWYSYDEGRKRVLISIAKLEKALNKPTGSGDQR